MGSFYDFRNKKIHNKSDFTSLNKSLVSVLVKSIRRPMNGQV